MKFYDLESPATPCFHHLQRLFYESPHRRLPFAVRSGLALVLDIGAFLPSDPERYAKVLDAVITLFELEGEEAKAFVHVMHDLNVYNNYEYVNRWLILLSSMIRE